MSREEMRRGLIAFQAQLMAGGQLDEITLLAREVAKGCKAKVKHVVRIMDALRPLLHQTRPKARASSKRTGPT